MPNPKYRLARTIVHLRIYVILVFTVVTIFFLDVLKDLKIEARLQDFLPQKHPFIKVQRKLTDTFGGLNQVSLALAVNDGDIFTGRFLEKIVNITEDLYLLEGVNISRVNSIASRHVKQVTANEEGFFVERLLRTPPQTNQEMLALKENILRNPNVYGKMVAKDLKSTLIQVDFESQVTTSYIFKTLQDLKEKYEDKNTKMYVAGRPILEGQLNFYLHKMVIIFIFSVLVFSVFLYLTFRSKRGIIFPLLDSALPAIWGLGAMKLMGLRLDASTVLVPFIVLALGISHSVQTMKRYYEEMRDPKMKSKHACVNAMTALFTPGLICVLTDGFGFLSLFLIPLITIKSMALAAGIGILANFPTSFILTPCVLSFLHRPKILEVEKEERHTWIDNFLKKLSVFSLKKPAGTILVCIFITLSLVCLYGITKTVIGDNSEGTSYLKPHDPYNQAESFINTNFGGTNSYYILVKSNDSLLKASKLKAMDELQQYILKEVPQTGTATSVANTMKALNMFMLDGKPENFFIPANDKIIAQYWFLYTISGFPSDFDHLLNRDEKIANIKFDLKDHKTSTVNLIVAKTKEYLKKIKYNNLNFSYAGGDIGMLSATNDIIKETLIPSIVTISLMIFFYVSFVYRSFTAAILLLLPLGLSNLIVFSLYGFLNIPISLETLPLACISEGLGVDYGIYIMSRFYEEIRRKHSTYRNILYRTLTTSGKAVFFSGFIVSAGIFVWVFSSILLQAKLGMTLCLSLLLSMITSLLMIPVLVWWIKPYFLFGKVRTRLKKRKRRVL